MPAFDADGIRARHSVSEVAARYGVKLVADGAEYRACCPFHKEKTPSFTVFDGGRRFYCFGCSATGDVIDFVQEWDGVGFREACESLDGPPTAVKPSPAARQNGHHAPNPYEGYSVGRPPENAPLLIAGVKTPPLRNPKRGRDVTYTPTLVHPYLDADGRLTGYVIRVDIGEGRKITPAILWMTGHDGFEGWSHGSMPEPRPIYGLDRIAAAPGKQILVVEGEKCADVAAAALPELAAASWCGGSSAIAKTDWTPLAARRMVLWPDADEPGRKAMQELAGLLHGLGCRVKLIDPDDDHPKGWDIADAIRDGWTTARLLEYAKARARDWTGLTEEERAGLEEPEVLISQTMRPSSVRSPPPMVGALAIDSGQEGQEGGQRTTRETVGNITSLRGDPIPKPDELDDYRSKFITDEHGKIAAKIDNNFVWMLRGNPATRGIFAFNTMENRIFLMARPPWDTTDGDWQARPLLENDVGQAQLWLQNLALRPRYPETRNAIKLVANYTRYNPVVDYLNGLEWDGCPRLQGGAWEGDMVPSLAVEYLGTPDNEIFGTFVTKWHVAAVARMLRPGIKVDTMIVLEGQQGKYKSTYLRTMSTIHGHEYFASDVGDISNAGSVMLLQGCWIIEIAELAGVNRKEIDIVKSWLSRTTDRYVPKYEGEPREVPRNYIVAGTHNPSGHGYLKDPTGARRFWPVPITKVDMARVEHDRDQIWAEAVTLYRGGMKWYLTEAEEQQAAAVTGERTIEDIWGPRIDEVTSGMSRVTVQAVAQAMALPIAQQTELTTKRISEHLRSVGWEQRRDKSWAKVGEMQQGEML